VEIRSYRAVFDLERRIYRVDRLRLNPGGIPVRGVVYCLAILAGIALLGALPLLGAAVRALPWYLRDLALPIGGAGLLTVIRIEGRPFHLAAAALSRHALGPRHLVGLRPHKPAGGLWRPEDLLVLPDGSDARLRRLRYTGPGAVLVRVAHERTTPRAGWPARLVRRPHLTVRAPRETREAHGRRAPRGRREPRRPPVSQDGQVIALRRGARLHVR
jgi:hypothetical protein